MPGPSPYYILVEHPITYTTQHPLPVRDVIESLKGLQDLSARFLPRTLSALVNEDVIAGELYVEGFEEGSFITDALTKLFFRSEEDVMNFLGKINAGEYREAWKIAYDASPGGDKPMQKIVGVSVVIAALIGAGAWYAAHDDKQAQVSIQANNNTVIAIGAEAYSVNPDAFAKIIAAAVGPDRKRLAEDAARVIAPAKNDPQASVKVAGEEGLTFVPATVKATPRTPNFGKSEFDEHYPDVDLQIRASDRDSSKRGWAGVIPGLIDHRVKVILADGVPADTIANKFSVRADVTVRYGKQANESEHKPEAIVIERLIESDGEGTDPE